MLSTAHFNTSHVYINQVSGEMQTLISHNFNTSHVYINRKACASVLSAAHFNTSHVYINPFLSILSRIRGIISIHLMFILIFKRISKHKRAYDHFNTSHVYINRLKP